MPERGIRETEWSLLEALWTLERATARQVTEHLKSSRGWAYSTVKTMLDRMAERNLIAKRQIGNVWEYSPAIPRQEAQRTAWQRFVRLAFGGVTNTALQFAAGETELSAEQRRELLLALEMLNNESETNP
ncbi:MAG: hypothetical protein HN348_16950 [Proteobacteria bacterium]|nr:hypothetical protein [Pseudomonadota bacterium]